MDSRAETEILGEKENFLTIEKPTQIIKGNSIITKYR
jgi:hypothetical protein